MLLSTSLVLLQFEENYNICSSRFWKFYIEFLWFWTFVTFGLILRFKLIILCLIYLLCKFTSFNSYFIMLDTCIAIVIILEFQFGNWENCISNIFNILGTLMKFARIRNSLFARANLEMCFQKSTCWLLDLHIFNF